MFDIILRVSQGQNWEEAILAVLPPRKFKTEGRKRGRKSLNDNNENNEKQLKAEDDQSDDVDQATEAPAGTPTTDDKII